MNSIHALKVVFIHIYSSRGFHILSKFKVTYDDLLTVYSKLLLKEFSTAEMYKQLTALCASLY